MEQLVIGSVVSGRHSSPEGAWLRPRDFTFATGGGVYGVVHAVRGEHPDWTKTQVAIACTPTLANFLIGEHALLGFGEFADQCGLATIRFAHQELIRRGADRDIDEAIEAVRRWTYPVRADREPTDTQALNRLVNRHVQLGAAVQRRAQALRWLPVSDEGGMDALYGAWSEAFGDSTAPAEVSAVRVKDEKTVLGGMMQHPHIAWALASSLSWLTFSAPARQDAFEAIVGQSQQPHTGPMDLAAVWKRVLSHGRVAGGQPNPEQRGNERNALKRLLDQPVTPGQTAVATRDLLADSITHALDHASRTALLQQPINVAVIDVPAPHPAPTRVPQPRL